MPVGNSSVQVTGAWGDIPNPGYPGCQGNLACGVSNIIVYQAEIGSKGFIDAANGITPTDLRSGPKPEEILPGYPVGREVR